MNIHHDLVRVANHLLVAVQTRPADVKLITTAGPREVPAIVDALEMIEVDVDGEIDLREACQVTVFCDQSWIVVGMRVMIGEYGDGPGAEFRIDSVSRRTAGRVEFRAVRHAAARRERRQLERRDIR